MNMFDEYYWEVRRAELIRAKRRREMAKVLDAAVNAVLAVLALAAVLGLAYLVGNREIRERAAYNEGYYGVDRATALAMAERGIGKSSEDVLTTDYTDYTDCEVR